jgi:hypothetical protein
MATGNPVLYTDFSGGLNLEAGPYLLEDNECQDCRNVATNKNGALIKRNGSTRISTYKNGSAVSQLESAHTLFPTTGAATGFIGVGPAALTNLVTNPSFETDTTGWTFAGTGWSPPIQARVAFSSPGSDGSYALFMSGAKDDNSTERYLDATTVVTGISVGESYTAEVNAYVALPGQYTYAFIEWRTAGDAFISYTTPTLTQTEIGEYTLSITGTAPATAAKAALTLRCQSNNANQETAIYFDNVRFKAATSANDSIVKITTAGVTTALKTGLTVNKPWEWVQGPTTASAATTLTGAHSNSVTTITVASTTGASSDGYITIGTEKITYTGTTPTTFTGCTRAAFGTSAATYSGGETVTAAGQGPYYGMNGTDAPQQWDGSLSGTAPWGARNGLLPTTTPYLIYHLDKFWASGDATYKGRIWSTGVTADATPLPDPCNWDTDYIDDVDPDDGQDITGLGKVGPYLLVFKDRKSYVLSDPVGRAYRTLSSNIGCISHRSIVETAAGTFFLSEDLGVCMTDGSQIRVMSEKIQPMLQTIAHSQPLAMAKSVGMYLHDSYWLSIPYSDTKNSITIQYQIDTGAWWIHTLAADDFALLDSGSGTKAYLVTPEVAGMDKILIEGVFTDNEQPYESYWEGPYWTWGQPHLNKRVAQYRIDGIGYWEVDSGTTFDDARERLDYEIWETQPSNDGDFGDSGTDFGGTGTFGGSTAVITQKRYYTPTDGWGRAWSLKLTDDTLNAITMEIYSVAGFLRPRSD